MNMSAERPEIPTKLDHTTFFLKVLSNLIVQEINMIVQFRIILIACLKQLFCPISGLSSKDSIANITNITTNINLQNIHC